jgi:N6-L-threonylcarbamoyladenine synthase
MGISQACGNCGQSLKVMGTSDGVAGSKTLSNNLDATLTDNGQSEQSLRVSVVYVLNKRGKPLMPCSAQKARILLKKGEANVVKRTPFTIQLTKQTGEAKQCVKLGVDPGYKHVGLSAVTDKKELISFDSEIRTDIVKLFSEKRMYRRTRRYRKIWHRKPRFSNRGIKEG